MYLNNELRRKIKLKGQKKLMKVLAKAFGENKVLEGDDTIFVAIGSEKSQYAYGKKEKAIQYYGIKLKLTSFAEDDYHIKNSFDFYTKKVNVNQKVLDEINQTF